MAKYFLVKGIYEKWENFEVTATLKVLLNKLKK